MKKTLLLPLLFVFNSSFFVSETFAGTNAPDTVKIGIYVTSIHDIDFKQKEYSADFWLWLKYKNPRFDFLKYLEIPQAKSMSISYSYGDTAKTDNTIYILLKLQCVLKDSWKIDNFPFNHQNLRLTIENAQFSSDSLVFAQDTIGEKYEKHALKGWGRDSLQGWMINNIRDTVGKKIYETAFGDTSIVEPRTEYSVYKVKIGIKRDAWGLFWKIFLGMYVSFLIAYVCFYIHADGSDSRFGLSVGALFAVIGNKYIIESSLPESTSFTLVDTLHGITLLYIFAVITFSAYSLKLFKSGNPDKANKFDMVTAQVLLLTYVILNIYFISQASNA